MLAINAAEDDIKTPNINATNIRGISGCSLKEYCAQKKKVIELTYSSMRSFCVGVTIDSKKPSAFNKRTATNGKKMAFKVTIKRTLDLPEAL